MPTTFAPSLDIGSDSNPPPHPISKIFIPDKGLNLFFNLKLLIISKTLGKTTNELHATSFKYNSPYQSQSTTDTSNSASSSSQSPLSHW